MVFMAPGMSTLITPAQVQMHFASDVSAGFFEAQHGIPKFEVFVLLFGENGDAFAL